VINLWGKYGYRKVFKNTPEVYKLAPNLINIKSQLSISIETEMNFLNSNPKSTIIIFNPCNHESFASMKLTEETCLIAVV
jgi:hypothetical protein